ncbi:peptidase family M48-domain-containing protein [Globomyces pollinis-pini]|nr:peptidase family M48-domain-containing protein [Globomyces pollinis-pini]
MHHFAKPNPNSSRFLSIAISFVCILVFAYIGYYLEKAPVTGRLRYMNIDPEVELNLGIDELHEYIESIRDCILPKGHPMHRMVERIAKELIKETELQHLHWEVYVVDDDEISNAFVMPSTNIARNNSIDGKIFVFSGIFSRTSTAEGMAALLSHEIGHVIARHSAESHSWESLMNTTLYPITFILGLTFADEFFQWLATEIVSASLPISRDQELEADHIGMMLLSKACYDPKEAIEFHKRLGENQDPDANMEYLSTHPLATTRVSKLQQAMPHAKHLWSDSKCDKMWTLRRMFDKATNYRFSINL